MGDYNRNKRSSGGGYRSGGGGYQRRDSGPRQMFSAVCDECGNNCEVPFRPSGDKPIYCSSCFEKREGGGQRRSTRRGGGPSSFEKRDNSGKQLLDQVVSLNAKLDRILSVIEPKQKTKPVVEKVEAPKAAKKVVFKAPKAKAKKVSKKKVTKKVAPKKK